MCKRVKTSVTIKLLTCFIVVYGVLLMQGCNSTDYQVGDISKSYCTSTDEAFRATIKKVLLAKGVVVGVDYCSAYHLTNLVVN